MAGLLLSQRLDGEVIVVIGNTAVAWTRIKRVLSLGAQKVFFIAESISESTSKAQYEDFIARGVLELIDRSFTVEDLTTLGREEVNNVVDRIFDTTATDDATYKACRRLRIPINTTDRKELSTFTLLSTHETGNFQMGVTTNGQGCRLANRLKRHIVTTLPPNVEDICNKVGEIRRKIMEEDKTEPSHGEIDDDSEQSAQFNTLISESHPTEKQKQTERSRYLNQIVEYFPLHQLSTIDLDDAVKNFNHAKAASSIKTSQNTGSISLIGAGPGHASFLTTGALEEINSADLILADKLVPSQVLDLIPKHTEVFIARKFPGNAERAQEELLEIGLAALHEGKRVIRLKQGDPFIFGRGGEEVTFFRANGYHPRIVPGLTSALAAPLLANIPATQRNISDQFLVCTGTGRKGVLPNLPEWVPTRTTVVLMGLHRVRELSDDLINNLKWPAEVPCCVVERASCPDQRIIRSKLCHIADAIEEIGSRPPGLLIIGHSCEVLEKPRNDSLWTVEEGFTP